MFLSFERSPPASESTLPPEAARTHLWPVLPRYRPLVGLPFLASLIPPCLHCFIEMMKARSAMLPFLLLAGCHSAAIRDDSFLKAPSMIDGQMASATIEDYILALPPNRYHEESEEQFAARVRFARSMPENKDAGPDRLFIHGDGTSLPRKFTLDRRRGILTVEGLEKPGFEEAGYKNKLRRVPGGWVRVE